MGCASGASASGPAPEKALQASSGPEAGQLWPMLLKGSKTPLLPAGTPLLVRTMKPITISSKVRSDTFEASLDQPLFDGQEVVAPKGAAVKGVLVTQNSRGGDGKPAISLRLTQIETAKGVVGISTNVIGSRMPERGATGEAATAAVLPGETLLAFRLIAPASAAPRP